MSAAHGEESRLLEVVLRLCGLHARWFRYRVDGYEHLTSGRSALVVGYHGRPSYDMFLLMALYRRREGRPIHGIAHRVLFGQKPLGDLLEQFGLFDGSDDATRAIVERGEHVLVLPGGTQECFRSSRTLYEVDWGRHRGYLRYALRHGLPIVPTASSGVDEFLRLYGDGYRNAKRLLGVDWLPLMLPLGLGGMLYPFALPRPVAVRQLIGPPIDLASDPAADPEDPAWIEAAHRRVTGAVQELLDRAQAGAG